MIFLFIFALIYYFNYYGLLISLDNRNHTFSNFVPHSHPNKYTETKTNHGYPSFLPEDGRKTLHISEPGVSYRRFEGSTSDTHAQAKGWDWTELGEGRLRHFRGGRVKLIDHGLCGHQVGAREEGSLGG